MRCDRLLAQTMSKRQAGRIIRQTVKPVQLQYKPRVAQSAPKLATPPDGRLKSFLLRYRHVPLMVGTAGLAVSFGYGVYVYLGYKKDAEAARAKGVPLDVSDRYNRCADTYDSSMEGMEWWIGIKRLREEICSKARGHVLEVAAGTGRNMSFYPLTKGVKSVTMVDQSHEMVTVSRIKWAKTNAWFGNAIFRIQDAAEPVPSPAPEGFDTVIQTFGVCSTPEPEKVLRNLGSLVNPNGGRILLLEHGKGHYEWLNNFLNDVAPAHADRFGCWWNKDIGEIVKNSGLEIVEARRYHFGTTWWFELRPPPRPVVVETVEQSRPVDSASNAAASWLTSWWK